MKLPRFAIPASALLLGAALLTTGCVRRATKVAQGNKDQIIHFGNGGEPSDLDPQLIQGVPEHNIIKALFEGLVTLHPKDLSPQPGQAERWEVSPDGKTYTFYLRANAKWSNGDPVTAEDFVKSYERILNPKLAAPYADMLQIIEGGAEYNSGKLTDFAKVGVKALGPQKLQITLKAPASYFLSMLNHDAWYPVPMGTIEKNGKKFDKGNRWTRPENIVSNGAFVLKDWKQQQEIVVVKNPKYWDVNQVRLKEIHFYPIESNDAEERAFRAGQLHTTNTVPTDKIDFYKASGSSLRIEPYYGAYYYRVNIDKSKEKNPALLDARVRRALSMSINRESLVKNVTRAGQIPAYSLTPPGPAGYRPKNTTKYDPDGARRLLSEAGFPGGKGIPKISVLINTNEDHKKVAEAIQQMWKKELGVDVEIVNQEWKVYLSSQSALDYQICRAAWIGDFPDPNAFLDIMRSGSGNNETGFANPDFDKLIVDSWSASSAARIDILQKAEGILMQEMPVIPIYFYTRNYLIVSSVKGWYPNLLDDHPWKYIYLDETAAPDKMPVLGVVP
jgi:oligopeptide transport system substrate-binding protein